MRSHPPHPRGSIEKQLLTVNLLTPSAQNALLGNLNKNAWWFRRKAVLLYLTTTTSNKIQQHQTKYNIRTIITA